MVGKPPGRRNALRPSKVASPLFGDWQSSGSGTCALLGSAPTLRTPRERVEVRRKRGVAWSRPFNQVRVLWVKARPPVSGSSERRSHARRWRRISGLFLDMCLGRIAQEYERADWLLRLEDVLEPGQIEHVFPANSVVSDGADAPSRMDSHPAKLPTAAVRAPGTGQTMRSGFGPNLVRQELIWSPSAIRTSSSRAGVVHSGGVLLVEAAGIEPAAFATYGASCRGSTSNWLLPCVDSTPQGACVSTVRSSRPSSAVRLPTRVHAIRPGWG
jgi:hypothetical protein